MTDTEIVDLVKADLKASESYKDEMDTIREKWIEIYNAKKLGNESKNKNKSRYISRDVKRSAEWQRSQLIDPFVSSPRPIRTYPTGAYDKPASDQYSACLNYFFTRGFNRYQFMSDSVKILQREGRVVARLSWKFEEREIISTEPIMVMLPTGTQVQIGEREVKKMHTVVNRPWVEPIDNRDLYIDPTAKSDIQNANFIIHRFKKSISELKMDGRYKNLDKVEKSVGDADSFDEPTYDYSGHKSEFKFKDKARRQLDVYEYWGRVDIDGTNELKKIVFTVCNDILIYNAENPFPNGFYPFASDAFNAEPFSIDGEANAETLQDGQILKSGVIRGAIDNMVNSTNGQVGIKQNALDPVNKRKFEAGENFIFRGTPNDFWQGSYNQLPGSIFDFYNVISNEMEASTGVKSFNQGIGGFSMGNSATATRGILGATEIRELDIVRGIRDNYIKPIMRMWMEMMSVWMEQQEVERITEKPFIPWSEDDLQALIDIDLEVSTASMDAKKAERIAFLLQTTAQFLPQDLMFEMTAKMYDLDRMPDLAEQIRNYQPQPDPYEEQRKQLELQKLQMEIEDLKAKAEENSVDKVLKQQKAAVEAAKARKLGSESDKLDQEFLDKETGFERQKELDDSSIKHNQEMAKNAMQITGKAKPTTPVTS